LDLGSDGVGQPRSAKMEERKVYAAEYLGKKKIIFSKGQTEWLAGPWVSVRRPGKSLPVQ